MAHARRRISARSLAARMAFSKSSRAIRLPHYSVQLCFGMEGFHAD